MIAQHPWLSGLAAALLLTLGAVVLRYIALRTALLSWAAAFLGFATLVVGLLALGQWLSGEAVPDSAPFLNKTYVSDLGTEVGGAGLDALLVGGAAGLISAWLHRWRTVDAQRASIRRRRRRGRPIGLAEELGKSSGSLPLAGNYANELVEDAMLRGTRFFEGRGKASKMTDVTFEACDMDGVDFRYCEFTDALFTGSELRRCDFRGAKFRATKGKEPFENAKLVRCRFDGAQVTRVDLGGDHRGGSFWRAEVRGGHLPPEVLSSMGPDTIRDLPNHEEGFTVLKLGDYVRGITRGRFRFIVRNLLALKP